MQLTARQVGQLLDFLVEQKNKGGLGALADAMQRDYLSGQFSTGEKVDRRSLHRILKAAKIEGNDGENEYSSSRLLDAIIAHDKPSVRHLFSYLQYRNFLEVSQSTDFLGNLQEFFRTTGDVYNRHHLDALVGDYYMYRRCWFHDDGKTYMKSFVRIRSDEKPGVYEFTEIQRFRPENRYEVSKGHLFVSGQAIIALCNAEDRSVVKFLSLTGLFPSETQYGEPAENFSGNGIASSDYPPHVGYGFHCVRVADEDDPLENDRINCEIIGFNRLRNENLDIFRKIIEYDGFRYVNFQPIEKDIDEIK